MDALSEAMHDVMSGDATLAGLLSTFEGVPAISSADVPVRGMTLPYIIIASGPAMVPYDTKNCQGWAFSRDVRCYVSKTGSAETVMAIAERVVALFHRKPFAVSGYGVVYVVCHGPVSADTEGAYGRVVTVRGVMIQDDGRES